MTIKPALVKASIPASKPSKNRLPLKNLTGSAGSNGRSTSQSGSIQGASMSPQIAGIQYATSHLNCFSHKKASLPNHALRLLAFTNCSSRNGFLRGFWEGQPCQPCNEARELLFIRLFRPCYSTPKRGKVQTSGDLKATFLSKTNIRYPLLT